MAKGQEIVRVAVPSDVCLSDSVRVGMGYASHHEVVVVDARTTLGCYGRSFLPDGVECGTMGCNYRTGVTFTGFDTTAVIRSVDDINYVRLNIEHSFIGDIYINITCPNGQQATLMNYSNNGQSHCNASITADHRGWDQTQNNVGLSTFMGLPIDEDDADACDSLAPRNAPGVGWNYCWSDNSTAGYTYAPGDGLIYRAANMVTVDSIGQTIDSSDVAGGTQFYHPEESFANLVGCPVNGSWHILVQDGWSADNGYIFEWELSLNEALTGDTLNKVTGYDLAGSVVRRVDDSTFTVYPPAGATGDTTVQLTATIHALYGESIDTTFSIHFHAIPHTLTTGHYCDGDTVWVDGMAITRTTHRTDTLPQPGLPCPRLRQIEVTFHPTYDLSDTSYLCPGMPPVYRDLEFAAPGDYTVERTTAHGCDSTTHLSLIAVDSDFSASPLFTDDTTRWHLDTILAGCTPFTIYMKDTCPLSATQRWHTGDTGWLSHPPYEHTYTRPGIYTLTYAAATAHGCTDTVTVANAVWVFERMRRDFVWVPDPVVSSHPEATLFVLDSTDGEAYRWTITGNDSTATLAGTTVDFSWEQEGTIVAGDFPTVLATDKAYLGPYGDTLVCTDTTQHTISIVIDWLQFPNLVTPNGDGINDHWEVVNLIECGQYSMNELWIYDRWGHEVYHARDIRSVEDFWYPDRDHSPDGSYYYRFAAKSQHGIVKRNGMIEVVR